MTYVIYITDVKVTRDTFAGMQGVWAPPTGTSYPIEGEGKMRRVKALVLGAVLVAGIVGMPAVANAGSANCGASRACIYTDPTWVGLISSKSGGSGLTTVASNEDNKTSSWENKTSSNGAWYDAASGTGNCFPMAKNSEVSNVAWPSYDKLTSWKMNGGC